MREPTYSKLNGFARVRSQRRTQTIPKEMRQFKGHQHRGFWRRLADSGRQHRWRMLHANLDATGEQESQNVSLALNSHIKCRNMSPEKVPGQKKIVAKS